MDGTWLRAAARVPTRRWPWRLPTCGSPKARTTSSTSPKRPSASTEFKDYILGETDDKFRQDSGMGGEGIGHSGAQDSRPGARVGRQADDRQLRQPRRRGRRLPHGLWHRMGAHDGAAAGHAGTGQAGRQHLGHHHGRSGRIAISGSRAMPNRAGRWDARRLPSDSCAREQDQAAALSASPCPMPF